MRRVSRISRIMRETIDQLSLAGREIVRRQRGIKPTRSPGRSWERQSASARSVAGWAVIINSAWKRGTATTLQLARVVQAARGELPYGGWTRLWKSGCIGFSKRKAEMLVVIGANLNNL